MERDHPESGANLTYIKQTGESDGDAGDQYTGLDRFTRVVDQRWIDGSGTALDRYGYTYDRNSNRLTKSNSLNGNLSESYSYDDLNRLANMTRGGSAYQSWDLDGLGNMNSVTTGNVTESRTHNDQNQLTSMGNATLGFDNNGNTVTDDQGHTLVYDAWNRLIAVKNGATVLETFTYDGQGWRITEAPAGGNATQLYYSSQWQVLEERQAGNATAQNVWGITYVDQLVLRDRDADQDASHTLEERLYVLQDANENVTAIVTTSGGVAERYVLDPYGVVSMRNADWSVRGDGSVSASSFGWVYLHQGGRYDVVAGEYSFRHRDYSPTMMRWMQQDPMGYVDGVNAFIVVRNNPSNDVDPLGLSTPRPQFYTDENGNIAYPGEGNWQERLWERVYGGLNDTEVWIVRNRGLNWDYTIGQMEHRTHTAYFMVPLCQYEHAKAAAWRAMKRFDTFNKDNNTEVQLFESAGRRFARFRILGASGFLSGIPNNVNFGVRLHVNEEAREITAATLGWHPIAGVRKWRIRDGYEMEDEKALKIETEGWEYASASGGLFRGLANLMGWFIEGESAMAKAWVTYLENYADVLAAYGARMSGSVIQKSDNYPVKFRDLAPQIETEYRTGAPVNDH